VVLVWVTGGMGAVRIDGTGIEEVVGCDDVASGKGVKITSPVGGQANKSSGNVAAELVKPGTSNVLTDCGNINTTSGKWSGSSGNTHSVAIFIVAVL
nr:hypothetical protein [Tanacetum cinerariifolium]